jgi:hypothetical protein
MALELRERRELFLKVMLEGSIFEDQAFTTEFCRLGSISPILLI